MFDLHLTPDLLQAVARGQFPVELFRRLMLAHAVRVSPRARNELDRWRFEQPRAEVIGQISGGRYGEVFERLESGLNAALETASLQRTQADLEMVELRRLPAAQRSQLVRQARQRFRSPALAEDALAEGWCDLLENAESAWHWADVAFWATTRLDSDPRLQSSLAVELRLRSEGLLAAACHWGEPAEGLIEIAAVRAEARRSLGSWLELEAEIAVLEAALLRRGGLERRALESLQAALRILEELAPEDRPWFSLAERELAELGHQTQPLRPSIRS